MNGTLNLGPVVDELTVTPLTVYVGGSVALKGDGQDPDEGPSPLTYQWSTSEGVIDHATNDPQATLTSPRPGTATVTVTVSDGDSTASATTTITFASLARRIGPVITPEIMPPGAQGNIAGPSPIATPDGLRLYFADHRGT